MCKETEKKWKNKATERSKEIKELRKEIVRQKTRAEKWRSEVQYLRKKISDKSIGIKDLSNEKSLDIDIELGEKVGTYQYKSKVIWLCVSLYKIGLSLRQVSAVIVLLGLFVGKNIKSPCPRTISIWVHKVGLGLLKQGQEAFTNSTEQWSLVIDESFSLGKSRLLVILAIRLSRLQSSRLRSQDVVPIVVKSQERWQSKDINTCLSNACSEFQGQIAYVTSDCGANLLGTYKEKNLQHVPDWAHYGANLLSNIYEKAEYFLEFNDKMGAFKRKRKQSIYTHYVPPTLSVKVRFMNYIPFLEWATIMMENYEAIPKEIKEELLFLKTLETFIKEVRSLFYAVQDIGHLIKENGINLKTYAMANKKMDILLQEYPRNNNIRFFIKEVEAYFKKTLDIYFDYRDKQDENAPFFDGIIATSEILECLFGKLKHRSDKNPKRGFSANSLLIALFANDFNQYQTIQFISNIDCKSLENWKNDNIENRNYTSFRNVFKKKGA